MRNANSFHEQKIKIVHLATWFLSGNARGQARHKKTRTTWKANKKQEPMKQLSRTYLKELFSNLISPQKYTLICNKIEDAPLIRALLRFDVLNQLDAFGSCPKIHLSLLDRCTHRRNWLHSWWLINWLKIKVIVCLFQWTYQCATLWSNADWSLELRSQLIPLEIGCC